MQYAVCKAILDSTGLDCRMLVQEEKKTLEIKKRAMYVDIRPMLKLVSTSAQNIDRYRR